MELSSVIYGQLEELSNAGNDLFDDGNYSLSIAKWLKAIDLLPEPKSDWEAYTWLSASIGDAYYQLENLDEARDAFLNALNGPDGQSNPFIHYRLGQCNDRLGINGIEHLLKAYMLNGEDIFKNDEDGMIFLKKLKDRGIIP
jgi:tetratricopeptide (TPR) repeat protein